MSAIKELLDIIERQVGLDGDFANEPDDEPVGWDGEGNPLQ